MVDTFARRRCLCANQGLCWLEEPARRRQQASRRREWSASAHTYGDGAVLGLTRFGALSYEYDSRDPLRRWPSSSSPAAPPSLVRLGGRDAHAASGAVRNHDRYPDAPCGVTTQTTSPKPSKPFRQRSYAIHPPYLARLDDGPRGQLEDERSVGRNRKQGWKPQAHRRRSLKRRGLRRHVVSCGAADPADVATIFEKHHRLAL